MPGAQLKIATIGGDGVGPEVVDATVPVLAAALAAHGGGVELVTTPLDWGGERWEREGSVIPADAVEQLTGYDAALFGAFGRPDLPDHEMVGGLISLRQRLQLAVNLRPIRSYAGVPVRLVDQPPVDFVVIRENSEGEYAGVGGRAHAGTTAEVGLEVAVHSRAAIERCAHYAFDLARRRSRRLTVVTKSNAMRFGYTLWDEVLKDISGQYSDVEVEYILVDAMTIRMLEAPERLDVVLASNLFGDILSDLAAFFVGGMGMAPSANIHPTFDFPGIYEPVHGSAPTLTGRGIANPTACLLSGALLLDHCGHPAAGDAVRSGVAEALQRPELHTPDLGGNGTSEKLSAFVLDQVSG